MYNAIGQLETGQLISVKVAGHRLTSALAGRIYRQESATARGITYSDGVTRIYIPRGHHGGARLADAAITAQEKIA